jgi:branched-chain amino acid transport system ATP-binding protein
LEGDKTLLQVRNIDTFLGKSHILQSVSLDLERENISALLGRNGVGKSTTLKSIIGITPPQKGSILFKKQEIMGERPYKICRRGIGYVPEERRIFPGLTVRENLLIGVQPRQKVDNPWTIDRIYSRFPHLKARNRQKGGHLSGGEQQMLTMARTLMGNPEVLLVDEPTEGLAPLVVDEVMQMLRDINQTGCSMIIVEHALDVALSIATSAYVMSKGQIVFQGTSEELHAAHEIREKYLEV